MYYYILLSSSPLPFVIICSSKFLQNGGKQKQIISEQYEYINKMAANFRIRERKKVWNKEETERERKYGNDLFLMAQQMETRINEQNRTNHRRKSIYDVGNQTMTKRK